jgi:hypothetical protein
MSGQIVHLDPDPHAAVQKLLPWFLTGRLEDAERAQVEEHLAACADCRAELETERAWQLLQPGQGAQVDVEAGWANMRALLAGHGPRHADDVPAPPSRAARGGMAAEEAGQQPAGDYRALAADPVDSASAVVRFRPDATEAQIRASLKASGARLVDGPTVTDAYVVKLPRDRYTEGLAKLRRQPGVALVEALETASPP